jgi:hypothetical protein
LWRANVPEGASFVVRHLAALVEIVGKVLQMDASGAFLTFFGPGQWEFDFT